MGININAANLERLALLKKNNPSVAKTPANASTIPLSKERRKVPDALTATEEEFRSSLPQKLSDIQNRLKTEINTLNRTLPVFGSDITENQLESRKNLRTLKSEVEAFRRFMGDDTADSLIATIDQITGGYDRYKLMSEYDSEETWNTAVRQYGYSQKYKGHSYDQIMKELNGLDEGSEEYNWLKKYSLTSDVLTLEDYDKLIGETENELRRIRNIYNDGNYLIHDSNSSGYAKELQSLGVQLENLKKGKWQLENQSKYSTIGENEDYRQFSNAGAYGRDGKYNFINDIDDARAKHYLSVKGEGSSYDNYSLMTDDEVGTYNYLYNKDGKRAAEEYLDYLEYELNERATQKSVEFTKDMATKHPVLMSALSVPANLIGGVTGMVDTVGQRVFSGLKEGLTGEYAPVDFNRSAMGFTQASNTTRSTVAQNIADSTGVISLNEEKHPVLSKIFNGKSLGDVYQLGMSIADFGTTALLTPIIGGTGAMALFGGSAGSSTMLDAVSRGATDDQAIFLGILSGTAEATFEKLSLDNLLGGNTKGIINTILKQGFIEGTEEFNTTLANNIADMVVMAENSNYRQNIAAYMAQGLSEEEAKEKAFTEALVDIGWDFVGGVLSGGVMGGGAYGVNAVNQNAQAQRIYGEDIEVLINEALEIDPNNTLAQELKTKLENGKQRFSGGTINSLIQQNEASMVAQDKANIQSRVTERLVELGETGDVHAIAYALAKQTAGEKLTSSERKTISDSKYGQRVANELNTENINSGEYSSDWTGEIDTNRINAREYSRLVASTDENEQRVTAPAGQQQNGEVHEMVKGVSIEADNSANEGEPKVSESGKTVLVETNEEVSIKEIASIKDGAMTLRLEDGRTVNADDVAFGSQDEAVIYDAVASLGVDAEIANLLVKPAKDGDVPAEDYALGMVEAFRYGEYSIPKTELAKSEYAAALTDIQRNNAYILGARYGGKVTAKGEAIARRARMAARYKAAAERRSASQNKGTSSMQSAAETTASNNATQKSDNETRKSETSDKHSSTLSEFRKTAEKSGRKLSDVQTVSLLTMEKLSAVLGVEFRVYESYDNKAGKRVYRNENGEEVSAPNGYYKNGKIYIDLNAGVGGKGTMLFTVSHELTHFIKEWSPAKFKVLANFLMKQYGEQGVSVSSLVNRQIAKAKENGRKLTWDEAYEEMVADSMETMLTSGNVVYQLSELKRQDITLWEKIRDWFRRLVEDLNDLVNTYTGYKPDSVEGRMVSEMKAAAQEFEALFTEGLQDASENYKAAEGIKKSTAEGGVKYQARRLSQNDIDAYIAAGTRKNINKIAALNAGQNVILTSEQEIVDFINNAIDKKAGHTTVAYGQVNDRLANEVAKQSGGKITIKDHYLELVPNDLQHAYEQHSVAKQEGDIALKRSDFERIPEYLDSFTEVLYAIRYNSGNVRVCVSKALPNGRILIIETVSKSRGALQFKNAIGVSEEKYQNEYLSKYRKRAEMNTRGSKSSSISLRDNFNSNNSIRNLDSEVKEKFSDRDSKGNILTQEQQEYFKDSVVRDEQGRLMVMYHGTPNGNHTIFRSGIYFTSDQQYADVYQAPGASMLSIKKDSSNPRTYEVYLNIKKPFDTRNPKERQIFMQEYYRKWGTGAPLAESGLPDWTDGIDLQEFIEEMEYDYDGLILDEGGVGGYGDEVISRGLSYVTFNSEQIKNVDNTNPTSNPDIRYSDRDPILEKTNKLLEKENAKLREDAAHLKEMLKLQRTVTNGTKFTKSSVEAAAKYLKKAVNAKGSTAELTGLLNEYYEKIVQADEDTSNGTYMEWALPAAEWLRDHLAPESGTAQEATEILRDLRGSRFSMNEQQKDEAAHKYGSFDNFRRQLMGTVVIANNSLMSLDERWSELSTKYPSFFPANTTANDMPVKLMEAVQQLRSMEVTAPIGEALNDELVTQEMLTKVYDSYWRVNRLRTFADVKQAEIDALNKKHDKRMSEIEELRQQLSDLEEAHKKELWEVRKENRKKQREIVDAAIESRKRAAESRKKTETKQKIRRSIMDINKLLSRGKEDRNVKEDMKELARTAISSSEVLFMDSYSEDDMIRYGVGTELTDKEKTSMEEAQALQLQLDEYPDEATAKALKKVIRNGGLKNVFVRERERLNRSQVRHVLGNLARLYSELQNSEQSCVREAYSETVYQSILNFQTDIKGTKVKDMTLGQLEELYKLYTMVLTTIRDANKMFSEAMKKSREEYGKMVMSEVDAAGKKKKGGDTKRALRTFGWNNLKPVYAFKRIASPTLLELYDNVRGGEDVYAVDVVEARKFYQDTIKKHGYLSWDMKKQYAFKTPTGLDFTLDLEQIMSLYAHSRREQSLEHLLMGGFVFDKNAKELVKKNGRKISYLKEDATAYKLSPEVFGEIIGTLNVEQKAFVEEMQEYLSDVMGNKGNEVSMQLYGVKLFGEKNYFPIRSAGQYMSKAREAELKKEQGQIRLANSGFTQATVQHAKNPVVLSNFTEVWSSHVNEMSMYHGFVLPMEDFRRVYNYRSPNVEETDSSGVVPSIENAFGDAATKYIDQLYNELNGGVITDPRESMYKKMMSNFKKAAVMASLSVVVQQPTAITRATAYVDRKYFGVLPVGQGVGRVVLNKWTNAHTKAWNELKKYAPVAIIKEMGGFDTNMSRGAAAYITAREYEGFGNKMKALCNDKEYRQSKTDELFGKLPELADALTWISIWQAVKKETAAKNKGVKGEELLKLAGKRFTEVVHNTQVYDSVLTKSANMRSKNLFMTMATAFMAEPTTAINMIEDAIRRGVRTGNWKAAGRTAGAVIGSLVFNNILRSFVYAMRDDDEDETYIEKYAEALAGGLLDDVNPMNYYPFLRDVWSIMQGYDAERSDMSLVSDLVQMINKAVNEPSVENVWNLVGAASSMLGFPLKNLSRDAEGVFNLIDTVGKDLAERDTTRAALWDSIAESVRMTVPTFLRWDAESKSDKLYDAIVSGDVEYRRRLEASYKDVAAMNTAIKKGLRENDPRIREAAQAKYDGNLDRCLEIFREIKAEKKFDANLIIDAINAEYNSLMPDEESTDNAGKAKTLFNADEFAAAVVNGDRNLAEAIKDDIIQASIQNGKTEAEADKSFMSSVASELKELFIQGDIGKQKTVEALVSYCGNDQEAAEEKVMNWSCERETGIAYNDIKDAFMSGEVSEEDVKNMYITYGGYTDEKANEKVAQYVAAKKYPELDGINLDRIVKYEQYGEPAGVSVDTFRDVIDHYESLEGERQEDTWAYIDSLPLTREQKDAVHCCIWASTTTYKAPWNN